VHILQVAPYFPPTWAFGGIPRIVDGLSRALVEAGAQVTVLTTDAFDAHQRAGLPAVRDHSGVRVLTAPNISNRLAYQHQLFLPRGARRLLQSQAGRPPVDLVHLHGHRHLLNNVAVAWARERGIPYVMTANGTLSRHETKLGAKLVWDLLVAGGIPHGAARCIAVSAADAAVHRDAGIPADRVERIPNGIDLGEFEAPPPRGSFRRRLGLGDEPIVAYLGQVSPRKGVVHLVRAFTEDHGALLGRAVLVVAGNDMGAMAEARAAAGMGDDAHDPGRVRFVGLLPGQERLALLADADVLVYASTDEVFGLVPFEGLLCGAPVIVGDDCGCGELIAEAGAGLLVRHGDVDGLRNRIRTLLHDRVAAAAMVGRGRRFIRERLGFVAVAAQHLALYRSVCEARS
jgi:glycosyltransferase involved in cell wall biosynthesis